MIKTKEEYKKIFENRYETLYNRKNNFIDNQELLEMISEMIESVEELLDKYDIEIPNEEKEEDIDNASNIYGTDYGYLEDCFREILKRYDVIGEN